MSFLINCFLLEEEKKSKQEVNSPLAPSPLPRVQALFRKLKDAISSTPPLPIIRSV
jgi:hypothetical protein